MNSKEKEDQTEEFLGNTDNDKEKAEFERTNNNTHIPTIPKKDTKVGN